MVCFKKVTEESLMKGLLIKVCWSGLRENGMEEQKGRFQNPARSDAVREEAVA